MQHKSMPGAPFRRGVMLRFRRMTLGVRVSIVSAAVLSAAALIAIAPIPMTVQQRSMCHPQAATSCSDAVSMQWIPLHRLIFPR